MSRLMNALKVLFRHDHITLSQRELYCIHVDARSKGYEEGYQKASADHGGTGEWVTVARFPGMEVQQLKR